MNVPAALRLAERISLTDEALRAGVVRESAGTFDALVAEHYADVTRLVDRLLGRGGDREDVVQEVFIAAYRAWPRFRGECRPSTWLTRIAVNKCRGWRRRSRLWRIVWEKLAAWTVEGDQRCPGSAIETGDEGELVRRAVDGLAQRDREVIVLHYFEQLSVAEMNAALGISRGAVEVRLSRARGRLKKLLAQHGIVSP